MRLRIPLEWCSAEKVLYFVRRYFEVMVNNCSGETPISGKEQKCMNFFHELPVMSKSLAPRCFQWL